MVAMPFGFDGLFWRVMGFGIDWMISVALWVAALPGAVGRIAAFGTGPLIAASGGIILLGLLRTPLRWSGAGAIGVAMLWALVTPRPDILISADGHNVAVRGGDGRLHLMRSAKNAFLLKEWLAADADTRLSADASLGDGVSCDDAGCVTELAQGGLVALALRPEAFGDDCRRAVVIATARQAPSGCHALVIDQAMLQKQGATALWRTRGGFAIDAVRPNGVDRPWAHAAGDGNEPEQGYPRRPATARAVDATPAEADLQADE
jgi:competence protein ComEC